MKQRLLDVLRMARQASQEPGAYALLPEIIQSLEAMSTALDLPLERRRRMAGALGRLVTEDFAFAESSVGGAILLLADEFASGERAHGES
jgi:hypothetical protein